jgi:CheY-like chemotaxis protein
MKNQTTCGSISHEKDQLQVALKVMVVDDNDALRESLTYALEYYGLDVTCCANATEALLQSMMKEFHYIITDYSMPGMNGVELVKRLRVKFPYTVIIGMSAEEVGEQFFRAGANDFLLKPFAPYGLAMMIDGGEILA